MIEVQAVGTSTRSHTITVTVTGSSNHSPAAANDSYSTAQDIALTVSVPGVLQNDSDPDGDPLAAQLGSLPAHGTLNLAADGSFTYTPARGYVGTDTFTYRAWDGTVQSNTASVALTVAAATDTVTILTATYVQRNRQLTVEATSTAQPRAVLTVVGFGDMTYSAKKKRYTYQARVAQAPSSVTVQSDKGGSASQMVTVK